MTSANDVVAALDTSHVTTEERGDTGAIGPGPWESASATNPAGIVLPSPSSGPTVGMGRAALLAVVVALLVVVGVLGRMLLAEDVESSPAPTTAGAPAVPAPAVSTASTADVADRAVCVDLDARGGSLYEVFVVPMLAGSDGRKSVDVDVARMQRATASVAQLDTSDLTEASPSIANEGRRLVASAQAMDFYAHVDGTALLTSFVGLSAECQKAGHKPSWFDANSILAN